MSVRVYCWLVRLMVSAFSLDWLRLDDIRQDVTVGKYDTAIVGSDCAYLTVASGSCWSPCRQQNIQPAGTRRALDSLALLRRNRLFGLIANGFLDVLEVLNRAVLNIDCRSPFRMSIIEWTRLQPFAVCSCLEP